MKKHLIILAIFISFVCNAQTTYSLTNSENRDIFKNGNYITDIHGLLDKFVGTWKWTDPSNSNTYFEIQFIKMIHVNNDSYFMDEIIGTYKYVVNGVVIVDTSNYTSIDVNSNLFAKILTTLSKDPYKHLNINIRDIIKQKLCHAEFDIINLSSLPLSATWTLRDNEGIYRGPRQVGFSIPTNVVLIKQ